MAERAAADKLQEDRELRRPSWDYNVTPMTAVRTLCRLASIQRLDGQMATVCTFACTPCSLGGLLEVAYTMRATIADPALAVSTPENCTTGDGP